MPLDYSTTAVVTQQTGTNWTVNTSAANLDSDQNLIDFIVLFDGVIQSNANFQKITAASVRYVGTPLATLTTVEVRRRTPLNPIKEVKYGRRFESSDWNAELNRISRRAAEYEAFGIGSVSGTVAPVDGAYNITWSTDAVYAPTRRRVYEKVESIISANNAALSGLQTQISTTNSNYQAADSNLQSQITTINTNYQSGDASLQNSKADRVSPSLTGTPTAPTASPGTNNTQIATTAFVSSEVRTPTAWTTQTLPGGWVQSAGGVPFRWRITKDGDLEFQLAMESSTFSGAINSTVTLFTLPAGSRPSTIVSFSGWMASGSPLTYSSGRLDVRADGVVVFTTTQSCSATTYVNFNARVPLL